MSGETIWKQEQRRQAEESRKRRERIAKVARENPDLTNELLAERFDTSVGNIEYALKTGGRHG